MCGAPVDDRARFSPAMEVPSTPFSTGPLPPVADDEPEVQPVRWGLGLFTGWQRARNPGKLDQYNRESKGTVANQRALLTIRQSF